MTDVVFFQSTYLKFMLRPNKKNRGLETRIPSDLGTTEHLTAEEDGQTPLIDSMTRSCPASFPIQFTPLRGTGFRMLFLTP